MQSHPDPLSRMETLEKQLQSIHERMSQMPRHNPEELNRPSGAFERGEMTPSNSQHRLALSPRSERLLFWLFAIGWPILVSTLMLLAEPYWRPIFVSDALQPTTIETPAHTLSVTPPTETTPTEPTQEKASKTVPVSNSDVSSEQETKADSNPAHVADRVFNLYERLEKLEQEKADFAPPAAAAKPSENEKNN